MVRIPESRLLIPWPGFNPWLGNAAQSKKKKKKNQTTDRNKSLGLRGEVFD